ncbi:hypothetical protein K438DRAFT_1986370 [Mycena galopus ATCC 62051]|nr:hypothetical protein K438DRAFT_1986370 [Mycena galopus ATCC 62051]
MPPLALHYRHPLRGRHVLAWQMPASSWMVAALRIAAIVPEAIRALAKLVHAALRLPWYSPRFYFAIASAHLSYGTKRKLRVLVDELFTDEAHT